MKINRHDFKLVFIVLLVIVVLIMAQNFFGDTLEQIITLVTAALGGFAILYQLRKDHQISKAEFIYNLNDTFGNNTEIAYIYSKLKLYRDNDQIEFSPEDGRRMGDYIMFFYILGYLVEENMIGLELVDKIFANKFFIFMNNPYVQNYQLVYSEINRPILELYGIWYNHRLRNNKKELYSTHSLSNFKNFYSRNKRDELVLNENEMHHGYN